MALVCGSVLEGLDSLGHGAREKGKGGRTVQLQKGGKGH